MKANPRYQELKERAGEKIVKQQKNTLKPSTKYFHRLKNGLKSIK